MTEEPRCKECKFCYPVEVHPWSNGVEDRFIGGISGIGCTLFLQKEMLGKNDDPFITVQIGAKDSIGCECFTRRESK